MQLTSTNNSDKLKSMNVLSLFFLKEGFIMKVFYARIVTMLFAVAAFIGVSAGSAFAAQDWAVNNYIEVTGQGMASDNARNALHARMLAKRAAIADAYRQLAEMVKGVDVDATTNVQDMMVASDEVSLRVSATIRGAIIVSENDLGGGGYEVTMRMPIFGSSNSLAKAVFPADPQPRETFPTPTVRVPSSGGYTGLIVDCRGLNLKPVMSPVIKNDRGQKIYGYKNLDPDKVIAQGMADYSYSMNRGVNRAGSKPLVVKAVAVDNHNGDPVVSTADANKILSENSVSHFLESTNVVFIR